jgi:hypothetical protein
MSYSPIAIKRSFVLGDLYNQCESSDSIPVHIDSKKEVPIGYVDESLGVYADAFLFHLPEDVCKKLSTSHYKFGFDYDVSVKQNKIKLNYILLISGDIESIGRRQTKLYSKE